MNWAKKAVNQILSGVKDEEHQIQNRHALEKKDIKKAQKTILSINRTLDLSPINILIKELRSAGYHTSGPQFGHYYPYRSTYELDPSWNWLTKPDYAWTVDQMTTYYYKEYCARWVIKELGQIFIVWRWEDGQVVGSLVMERNGGLTEGYPGGLIIASADIPPIIEPMKTAFIDWIAFYVRTKN
jgi:hypothetical protein